MIPELLFVANVFLFAYLVVLDAIYGGLALIGWRAINDYVRRRPLRDYRFVETSPLSLPLSILAPAYNEEPTIVASIEALLQCRYPAFEVIVINDGSKDRTLEKLEEHFALVPVRVIPRANLKTKPVRQVYESATHPGLIVIDKENGGKADSLNAGIRHARTPLFCTIDADTLLDPAALARLTWEFQSSPDTVAVGGIVRILNGSTIEHGKLTRVHTPGSLLINLQILEYLRAFLSGRVGWSRLGMLLIISGAFGLFRRDAVIEAGGYDTTTVGEDAELVLRLHRHRRDHGQRCRITFFPDPICWTEAPASIRVLARQRDRWQRGLIEMLMRHKGMIGRPRYGAVGMVALPYFVVFELLGPTVEVIGILIFGVSLATGAASAHWVLLFLALSTVFGLILSAATLLMEERAFRRYPGWKDLGRLVLAALVENLGWRQLMNIVRLRSWWTVLRNTGWGEMTRTGFSSGDAGDPSPGPAAVAVPVDVGGTREAARAAG